MRTVTIDVHGEPWEVPYGFGAAYKRAIQREAKDLAKGRPGNVIHALQSVLGLVGYTASISAISDWDLRKRTETMVYCANVHARASDNPLPRHPRPKWMPEPWQGPPRGFGEPGPTALD